MNGARFAYLSRVYELMQAGEDIYFVCSDYAAPVLDEMKVKYAQRYVSVGIAEQNLMQVASGLALAGKRVVAYGLAPFPSVRAFDQIRNSIVNMGLPVSIVVVGTGLFPEYGVTHNNTEDVAIMRTLPGMQILNVTDNVMARAAADALLTSEHPLYIRIGKDAEGELYTADSIDMKQGFQTFTKGKDVAVIACGYDVHRVLRLLPRWRALGLDVRVIDLFSIPYDAERLLQEIAGVQSVVTVEEHVLKGGIGSEVLEMLCDHGITKPAKRLGISYGSGYPKVFGSTDYFRELYGLSDDAIVEAVERVR